MRYTQLTSGDVDQMLDTIGVASTDELFETVPREIRAKKPLNIPDGISELELLTDTQALAAKNNDCSRLTCFLGGGAYDHFVPTLVDALAGQSEFLTAYTPYQAEASQGILQLFYEFQTMICELTGMEVANASLYEGATAAAEAVIMAANITRRNNIVVSEAVHPDTMRVLKTYAYEREFEIATVPAPDGSVDPGELKKRLSDGVAGVVVQSPNFYGIVERIDQLVPVIHDAGALAIVATDPIAGGLLKRVGDFDVDIVVGEGQALGIPLQYGGPYLGLLACREAYLRKMPGRVVGVAHDASGRRGFCLALQTREQHIKRERATSNVCTNQGLLATRAAIYMASLGKAGIREVASQCFDKAHYAAERIAALDGYSLRFDQPFFKEFVVQTTRDVGSALASCRKRGVLCGPDLGRFDKSLAGCFLVAVTEKRSKAEIDELVSGLADA